MDKIKRQAWLIFALVASLLVHILIIIMETLPVFVSSISLFKEDFWSSLFIVPFLLISVCVIAALGIWVSKELLFGHARWTLALIFHLFFIIVGFDLYDILAPLLEHILGATLVEKIILILCCNVYLIVSVKCSESIVSRGLSVTNWKEGSGFRRSVDFKLPLVQELAEVIMDPKNMILVCAFMLFIVSPDYLEEYEDTLSYVEPLEPMAGLFLMLGIPSLYYRLMKRVVVKKW